MDIFKKSVLTTALLSVMLSGCNSMPSTLNYDKVTRENAEEKAKTNTDWLQDPAVRTIYSNVGTTIKKPNAIPDSVRNKDIEIDLMPKSTMQDFLTAISKVMEVPTIADSEELASIPVYIPYFKGNMGDLLDSISKSKNVSFVWESNMLMLKSSTNYMITLPQDQTLMEKVATELVSIGAVDINPSVSAGILFYSSTPRNQEKIEKYFDRLVKNSSLITLQVMVINVNLERERKEGFDWSSLQAKLGNMNMQDALKGDTSTTTYSNDTVEGSSNESSEPQARVLGEFGQVTSGGLAFNVARESFDLIGLFNLLSTYGNTKTTQDVSLKTISGKEVKLESNQEIPYVSDVSLSTTDSGTSNSGLDTDVAKNGLTMTFMPYYEADSKLVSIDIDISLETLLGFMEMSAGNQFGTITQPRTQKQQFNNTVRIPVGETVIIGGVSYESISDNRSTLSLIEKANLANQNIDVTNNSLFVLVRPTVVIYEPKVGGLDEE